MHSMNKRSLAVPLNRRALSWSPRDYFSLWVTFSTAQEASIQLSQSLIDEASIRSSTVKPPARPTTNHNYVTHIRLAASTCISQPALITPYILILRSACARVHECISI